MTSGRAPCKTGGPDEKGRFSPMERPAVCSTPFLTCARRRMKKPQVAQPADIFPRRPHGFPLQSSRIAWGRGDGQGRRRPAKGPGLPAEGRGGSPPQTVEALFSPARASFSALYPFRKSSERTQRDPARASPATRLLPAIQLHTAFSADAGGEAPRLFFFNRKKTLRILSNRS